MNKNKLSLLLFIFSIAFFASLNMNIQTNEYGLTDVSLNNVEALASESSGANCHPVKGICSKNGITSYHASFQ